MRKVIEHCKTSTVHVSVMYLCFRCINKVVHLIKKKGFIVVREKSGAKESYSTGFITLGNSSSSNFVCDIPMSCMCHTVNNSFSLENTNINRLRISSGSVKCLVRLQVHVLGQPSLFVPFIEVAIPRYSL